MKPIRQAAALAVLVILALHSSGAQPAPPAPVPAVAQGGPLLPLAQPAVPLAPNPLAPPGTFPLPAMLPPPVAPTRTPENVNSSRPIEPRSTDQGVEPIPNSANSWANSPVIVEWVGASVAQLGQPADYTIVVRNTSSFPVQKAVLNVRMVSGMMVTGTNPKTTTTGEILTWQVGTLLPRQAKNLQARLVISAKKDISPEAWVTFVGSSTASMRIHVHEPKLDLKLTAPARVVLGESASFQFTVSNPGDGVADQVKVHAVLSSGLEHVRGKQVDFEIGNLAAGESRSVQLVCAARLGGEQKCEVMAEARGGLRAQDQTLTNVVTPRLEINVSGPGLRYVDRPASYSVRVINRGDVSAGNVTLSEIVPTGFKFVSATDGGRHESSSQMLSWFLGEVAPGQAREVKFDLVAIRAGEYKHRFKAVSERSLRVEVEREFTTRVEDLSALLLEVTDTDDPIEVGKETTYEILVTNAGSKTETNIKLACTVPDKMEIKTAQGPARYRVEGNQIVFEPLAKLVPRGDAVYQIKVKALTPGDVRFKTEVSSTSMVEPITKIEPTRIYADQP